MLDIRQFFRIWFQNLECVIKRRNEDQLRGVLSSSMCFNRIKWLGRENDESVVNRSFGACGLLPSPLSSQREIYTTIDNLYGVYNQHFTLRLLTRISGYGLE